ncbi:DNA replication and repair protein RecF [Pandoraea horticolens]|uniref:DNA replication and repair protein RecF n=1 Tax=Pandoraea horticolens TaxID=2508298 RepID=A0A5E4WZ45_9BURK|nr:ATP-binding protein [Pandoraea horticolens]VVE28695.1 DNA replication and repair protein RecF [Pandoraea horticolens]
MELIELKIESFKKIEEVTVPLSDVNILVGPNGCGKSSIVQAVHLASCVMRQADRVAADKTATVAVDDLDYLPTDDYKTLGHGANWGNKDGTPSSTVTLKFRKPADEIVEANCRLRSARNAGISITGSVAPDLLPLLRGKSKFFSAYIPGISGIPNKEERKSKKVILKSCSFGDSNVILRNALLLLKESSELNIPLIQKWIENIIGPIEIHVEHDNDSDLHIHCSVSVGGSTKPLELVGTGYLQLIQIFCYVLLFQPGVLLIDEPDIHLHPHVQERLAGVLAELARERGIKILLTTHSPFIVRGAPPGTNVCWLQDGKIESKDRMLVETALGWGAFGKRLIIVSEDTNTALLKKIVAQWPEIDRSVAFYPGNGYKSVPSPAQAKELAETLGQKFKILVHRDRDSLTDAEVRELVQTYAAEGVGLWLPTESDVEAYFCQPEFLEVFLGCTQQEASDYITDTLTQHAVPLRQQFDSQRAAHNQEFHAAGGGQTNEEIWGALQARPLKGGKGKFVFKQLKNKVPAGAFSENKILAGAIGGLMAIDLKHSIEQLLQA